MSSKAKILALVRMRPASSSVSSQSKMITGCDLFIDTVGHKCADYLIRDLSTSQPSVAELVCHLSHRLYGLIMVFDRA